MSTHRRAWTIRAAVIAVVTSAGLFGIAAPAYAADPVVSNYTLNPSTIDAGGQTTARFTVRMSDNMAGNTDVTVSSNNNKVTCQSGCSVIGADIDANGTQFEAVLKATGNFTGNDTAVISVKVGNRPPVNQTVNINAPQATAQVPEVSGTVVSVYDNSVIKGAKVRISDSASHLWDDV